MYNKVILAGNLTRDIEVRYTQGGSAIGKTAIAASRKYKSQTGEQKEEVVFIDLTFFGRTAEIANQYLKKGSKVLVDGRLTFEQWTAQDGSKRSRHSVTVENLQMLGSKNDDIGGQAGYSEPSYEDQEPSYGGHQQQTQNRGAQPSQQPQRQQQQEHSIPEIDLSEDEIPF